MSHDSVGRVALRLAPLVLVGALCALVGVGGGLGSASPAGAASASGETLVAGSICEAQRLKQRKQADPSLQIEIPKEFDKRYPSLSACESHELAWDEGAPGPRQPIPFSHAHHAGEYQIDCFYCHSGTDRSAIAGMPSVELCMGCHAQFSRDYDELEGIRILKQHWEEKRPIEWQQIHRLPEHVQFRHNRHVAAGVACEQCHGPVRTMHKVYLVPDTKSVNLLPAKKLEMGWCLTCHWQHNAAGVAQASDDCLTCHH